ncbi:MAG: porin family protein [Cyclobacteriaceae bacterium]
MKKSNQNFDKKIILLRNILLLSVFAFIAPNISNGQDGDFNERITFGIKAGANYSNVFDEQGDQFVADPKFGLAAGAFFTIPLGRYLGVHPEVIYSQKGFQSTGRFLGSNYTLSRTSNFLDIPILFALKPAPMITLLAGPQFSYLLSQKDDFEGSSISIDQQREFENDNIRNNILGFVVGGDINIDNVVLGLRAGWDLRRNHGDGDSSTPRYKNMLYQATLGFRF